MTITAPAHIQTAQNKNDNTPIRFALMMVETKVVIDDVQGAVLALAREVIYNILEDRPIPNNISPIEQLSAGLRRFP